jgi:hypothetical protein
VKAELSVLASDTDFIEGFEILMGRLILISGLPQKSDLKPTPEQAAILQKIATENEFIIAKTISHISLALSCNVSNAEDYMNELSDHLYHIHDSESYFVSKAGMLQIAVELGCPLNG